MIWVGSSWKMNGTLDFARDYANRLREELDDLELADVQPFLLPPITALASVRENLGSHSSVLLGVQNSHWEDSGEWTGEISPLQALDAGARLIEVGHSERRAKLGETDDMIRWKIAASIRHKMYALLCVGEPIQAFDSGESIAYVQAQVSSALCDQTDISRVLIAYEPRWAIGALGRDPASKDISGVIQSLSAMYGSSVAAILYGGSVTTANASRLLELPGINGLFVGRAALSVAGFIELIRIAAKHQTTYRGD